MQPKHDVKPTRKLKNDKLLRVIHGEAVDMPPVWLMRQAGRYLPEYQEIRGKFPNFMSLCRTSEATTEVALQPIRRFDLDAAIVFSDILTIADSLDLGLSFIENIGPVLANPITNPTNIHDLAFDQACDKLSYVYEAVQALRDALGNRLPIIGFSGSPWTQSCYMLAGRSEALFNTAKRFAYTHPVAMEELINQLAYVTADYLYRQYQAGADVLFVIDTWGGILPDSMFHNYSANALRQIGHSLQRLGCQAPLMFFSKGLTHQRINMLVDIPQLRCIGLDWTADIASLQQQFPHFTFQGNLDPSVLQAGPMATQQHTYDILSKVNTQKHYIAGLGHGILPQTPIASVHAFIDTIRHGLAKNKP